MKKKIPHDLIRLLEKYGVSSSDRDKEYETEELTQLIDRVGLLIQRKKKGRLDIPNQGNRRLLAIAAQVVVRAITASAIHLAETGMGPIPKGEGDNKKSAKDFGFDVVMHAIVGSNLLTILFTQIGRIADTDEKNQRLITEALKLLSFLIVIRAATKGDEDRMVSLVDDFKEPIGSCIDLIGNHLNDEIIRVNIADGMSEKLALKLQQAKLDLQKGEIHRFIKTSQGALDLLGITPDLLEKNFEEIEELANTLCEAMELKDDNPTAITQQVM